MSYPLLIKEKAKKLRKRGYSLTEVSEKLGISKSTSSLWLRHIRLNKKAKSRLKQRNILGQYKTSKRFKEKRQKNKIKATAKAIKILKGYKLTTKTIVSLCSFLFWAEGAKNQENIRFINSNPLMIKTYLKLFRKSFLLDPKKFRALVHIHEYHNEKQILKFWSKTTQIPLSQFHKSYKKPHTKKRKRPGYMGSICVTYYDAKLAREFHAIYNTLAHKILGV